ncbi:MAG: hypothetical protein NTW95_15800 [Candidatus Aminicenantes bacterium]|nr:hypothetical protein [Candidatus Aminicenantes bacterium]
MKNKIKLRREFECFKKKKVIKCIEMERMAKKLGRTLFNRGKEPTWINLNFKELRPLAIPHHGGDLPLGTSDNILNQLEEDMIKIEELK